MGMIIKHQLISTQRRACLEGLTPLAQAYFNCVPVFDVNEFRESAEEEVDLAVTERNRARDNLRTLYSTWFNNGNSGPGCFSDPFWMWHSLKEAELTCWATATGQRPVLPTAAERENTLSLLHITDTRSKQCTRCGAKSNTHRRSQDEMTVHRRRSFAEEIHDWLHGDRSHGTLPTCRARVPTESSSTPGKQTVEVCGGRVVQLGTDLHFGEFFVVPFTNTQLRPQFQELVDIATAASRQGPMVRYRVVGIISYSAHERVHYISKMYHDGMWWCYDDMVNNSTYKVIDNVDTFSPLDRLVLLMKESALVSPALLRALRSSGNPGSSSSREAGAAADPRPSSVNQSSSSSANPAEPPHAKRRLGLGHVHGAPLHSRPVPPFVVPKTPTAFEATKVGEKRGATAPLLRAQLDISGKRQRQATPATAVSSSPAATQVSLASSRPAPTSTNTTLLPTRLGPRQFINVTSWPAPKQASVTATAIDVPVSDPSLPRVRTFAEVEKEQQLRLQQLQREHLARREAQQQARRARREAGGQSDDE